MRVLRALAVVNGIGRALHDVQRPPAARLTSDPNCRVQALKSQAPARSSSAAPGQCSVVAAPAARWRAAVAAQEALAAAEVSGLVRAASVVSRARAAAPAVWPVSPAGGSGRAPLMRGREPYLAALWELSGGAGVVAASGGFVAVEFPGRPTLSDLDEFSGVVAWFNGTQGSGPGAFCCGPAAGGAGVCAMGVWVAIIAVAMAKAPAVIVRLMFTAVLLCDRSVRDPLHRAYHGPSSALARTAVRL